MFLATSLVTSVVAATNFVAAANLLAAMTRHPSSRHPPRPSRIAALRRSAGRDNSPIQSEPRRP